jgi:hypothetical protein
MVRTTFLLLALATVAAASVAAAAQAERNKPSDRNQPGTKAQPSVKVNLECTWNGPKEFVKVTVRNTSNSTIPAGEIIHWSVNSSTKGSINLQSGLAPNQTVFREVPLSGNAPYAPKAWYWK